jgi:DNA-directed RNA polymerase specialized sigma24 family protein
MVERFFDELRRGVPTGADKSSDPPEQNEKSHGDAKRDESFLAALPTIRQIVWRKLFSRKPDDAPDLVQKVVLQLLTWRENNPNKIEEMSPEEWQSFASKAAHHAVNSSLSGSEHLIATLDEASEVVGDDLVAGNTQAELASLLSAFWQGICQLSLRQRRALLFSSDSLLVLLRFNGLSNQNLTEILEVDESELLEIIDRLPLKDAQIAQLIADRDGGNAKNRNISSLIKSIKKARHEARAKLQKLVSE